MPAVIFPNNILRRRDARRNPLLIQALTRLGLVNQVETGMQHMVRSLLGEGFQPSKYDLQDNQVQIGFIGGGTVARFRLFVEKVFHLANLPLVCVPVQRDYNSREIATLIAPYRPVKAKVATPLPQPEANQPTDGAPVCPKCGIPMILRTIAQGEHKGKQFYGCANYPRCREVKPAKAHSG